MSKRDVKGSRGQVLLIVVIIMVVALTIGLSVASRTITSLKLSRQNEDAQKAFQAASAGIDRYINQAGGASGFTGSQNFTGSDVATTVKDLQGNRVFLNNGEAIDQDRGIDLWLSTYPTFASPYTGTITIYWGVGGTGAQSNCNANVGAATSPALEVLVLTGTVASPTLAKYVYDDCSARRTLPGGNGFADPTNHNAAAPGITGTTFLYRAQITVANGLIAKIIPIYNSTKIAIEGSANFPPQGKIIESVGTAGDTKRKIVYYESYPQIPNEIFPYAILSQ